MNDGIDLNLNHTPDGPFEFDVTGRDQALSTVQIKLLSSIAHSLKRIALAHEASNSIAALTTAQVSRPSMLYRPRLTLSFRPAENAMRWKASYSDIYAWGKSPKEAMANFDREWGRAIDNDANAQEDVK